MLDIIIPTYNRGEILKKTLPSYLEQRLVDKIVVVDDGSTDRTPEILADFSEKDERIVYLRNSKNNGLPAARNLGLSNSEGMVLFGEDDILLEKNYVKQLVSCMKKTNADIIGGRLITMEPGESFREALDRHDKIRKPIINKIPKPVIPFLLELNFGTKAEEDVDLPLLHACSLFKREIFNELKFDESYSGNAIYEEIDLFLSAVKKGYTLFLCPHTHCFHLPITLRGEGGVHSLGGAELENILRQEYWTIKNHLHFVKKHRVFLKQNLDLDNRLCFNPALFILTRIYYIWANSFAYIRKKF